MDDRKFRTTRQVIAAGFLGLLLAASPVLGEEISPKAVQLRAFLNSLHVESGWLAFQRVDWYSGVAINAKTYRHSTHCSAFAASVCCRLGVDLPRPPEYPLPRLANAQYDWLIQLGPRHEWKRLNNGCEAQSAANRGELTLAVYRNPDDRKPGHIAVVLPGEKSPTQIEAEGPNVMQAGAENYQSVPLATGFRHHPEALARVAYFSHLWCGH